MTPEQQPFKAERIVISSEDLENRPLHAPPPPPPPAPTWPTAQPPVGPPPGEFPMSQIPGLGAPLPPLQQPGYSYSGPSTGTLTWDQVLNKVSSNSVIAGLTAGALGGFLGWVFSEVIDSPSRIGFFESSIQLDWDAAFWVMIYAIVLAFVLMGWEGFTSRSTPKMFREGGIGAAIGLGAGLISGFVAQAIYGALISPSTGTGILILIRGFGWAIFGGLVGLGLGIRCGAKATLNGLLGGAAGGFVGGAAFQILGESGGGGGTGLRFVGLTITGIGIGLGIGLVSHVRRDAWLLFSGGPMQGKQFILQTAETSVGSDYRCDIVLVKDPSVAPVHAVFLRQPNGVVAVMPRSATPVLVNGVPSAGIQLRSGDAVTIGASAMTYEQRSVAAM